MAVPRSRISKSRRNKRRSHDAKEGKFFSTCTNCKSPHLPHHVCPSCGQYKGRSYKDASQEV